MSPPKIHDVIFNQFWGKTLEDFSPTNESQREVLESVQDYCDRIKDHRSSGTGLTLVGPPGTGKTMLASIVLMEADRNGYTTDALEMSTFVSLFHQQFSLGPYYRLLEMDMEAAERWDRIDSRLTYIRRQATFVLFDDVGKEYDSGTGWSNAQWDHFLRFRYNAGNPTLITSNTPINEWGKRYSDSMESFLHEATFVIPMGGEDHRRRRPLK